MKPTLLVMAAGMGSRYGGLKQLDGFGPNGETILEYSVYDAIRAGFGKVVFVIRRSFAEQFMEKIGDRFNSQIEVAYVYQEMETAIPSGFSVEHREKPWGTGHAVLVAKDEVTTPFAAINADDYYGVDAYKQMAELLTQTISSQKCAMVGYVLENTLSPHGTVNRGVCKIDTDGHLQEVVEWHKLARKEDAKIYDLHERTLENNVTVSMNFWGFDPSIFASIEDMFTQFLQTRGEDPTYEFYIPLVVNKAIHELGYDCIVRISQDQWCGVTYPEDKEHVASIISDLISQDVYPSPLRS